MQDESLAFLRRLLETPSPSGYERAIQEGGADERLLSLWGLAVAGEAGVVHVLELLRRELANALTLLGAGSPAELSRDQVEP